MPFFSVIVPVYNSNRFIDKTIISVYNQTFNDWELIIIDDGSLDGSLDSALSWKLKDERIKVLTHKNNLNKGVSASRNLGINSSLGEWITFLDSDDLWDQNKLEIIHKNIIENYSVGFIYHRLRLIDENDELIVNERKLPISHINFVYGQGITGITINPFNKVIRKSFDPPTSSVSIKKSILNNTKGFNENVRFTEDFQLWLEALQFTDVLFIEDILGSYRISSIQWNSTTNNELKSQRRYLLYTNLLVSCNREFKYIISYNLVTVGFVNIFRYYITNYDIKSISTYLFKIVYNNKCHLFTKFILIFVLVKELVMFPIRRFN